MGISTKLIMSFKTMFGKKVSISVDEPRANLSETEIKNAMEAILAKNIFSLGGDDLTESIDAKVIQTDTTEYDLV